jgi:quinol monooxygenase YgiN
VTPFTMLVTLFIKPECREEYLEALHEVLPPARAEPACVSLRVHEVLGEPGTIVLVEDWRDRDEYVQEVMRRDYFQRYLKLSEPMYAKPRVVTLLCPIAPDGAAFDGPR